MSSGSGSFKGLSFTTPNTPNVLQCTMTREPNGDVCVEACPGDVRVETCPGGGTIKEYRNTETAKVICKCQPF